MKYENQFISALLEAVRNYYQAREKRKESESNGSGNDQRTRK